MTRTIPVGYAVPTARTSAPMPNATAIHLAALLSKSRTSGKTMRSSATGTPRGDLGRRIAPAHVRVLGSKSDRGEPESRLSERDQRRGCTPTSTKTNVHAARFGITRVDVQALAVPEPLR
jgi:hypothetical protein